MAKDLGRRAWFEERERGASSALGIAIILFTLLVVWIAPPGGVRSGPGWSFNFNSNTPDSSQEILKSGQSKNSSYKNISLDSGNAERAYQSYEEYVTIENWGDEPVDITGWQFKNGKDARAYNLGGGLQRFSADIAIIPQGTLLLPSGGQPAMQNIILKRGEKAVVVTGSVGVTSPYKILSFKENKCTGYIESHPDYAFNPALSQNCPKPDKEPGLEELEPSCRRFVERLSSCKTPEFSRKDSRGEPCDTCINGERLSSACAAFIKERFSYQGCLRQHSNDPDFYSGNTWRIFLGRGWEMYADDYETIELFDKNGNLVDFVNY